MPEFILEDLDITQVNHLPIIKAYAEKIQLVETVDSLFGNKENLSMGKIILAMVMDTLSGRSPLYRMNEFFEDKDIELLLGEDVDPSVFKDHTMSRRMDLIHEFGTNRVFGALAANSVRVFGLSTRIRHHDTTSISVFGDYDFTDPPFMITYGHSKDKRPDLKQFLISMLCVDRNIPIFGKTEDGNASDKAVNNALLTSISKYMATHGLPEETFIYVADAAVVTEDNLNEILRGENHLLTRLPATYKECSRVIEEAVRADEWEDIGVIAETKATRKRPAAYYRSYESSVSLYGNDFRAVVIHSSAHDKRRHKRIDRAVEKERKELGKLCKKINTQTFYCLADAQAAADRLVKNGDYHTIRIDITEVPKFAPGRPTADLPRIPVRHEYILNTQIEEDPDKLEQPRMEAGCFVLITTLPKREEEQDYSSGRVLQIYKEQYGIEKNFGFLKDPVIVNSIFLKKPERIEVLGLILLISLLLWRLIERSLRLHVENTRQRLPGWDGKSTTRPTSFMMTTKFTNIMVAKYGNTRKLVRPLKPVQKEYLKALGLTAHIFTVP